MNCNIIYYIAYKTGYIQRIFSRKFRDSKDIVINTAVAAVSREDMFAKFKESLETSDLIFVIGGLATGEERNVMTVLSDYFSDNEVEVTFNKRIVNPSGGKDGYLIRSGEKYIVVLPDEPSQINDMVGNELMKNIDITEAPTVAEPEPVTTHSIVFAPEPDYTLDKFGNKKSHNTFLKVCIAVGVATVICAAVWLVFFSGFFGFFTQNV